MTNRVVTGIVCVIMVAIGGAIVLPLVAHMPWIGSGLVQLLSPLYGLAVLFAFCYGFVKGDR